MNEPSRARDAFLHLLADILLIALALFISGLLRPRLPIGRFVPVEEAHLSILVYAIVAAIWVVATMLLSVYVPRRQRAIDEAQTLAVAMTLTTAIFAGVLYFSLRGISRLQVILFYLLALLVLIVPRLIIRAVLRRMGHSHYARRRVLVLGAGQAGREIINTLARNQWAGLEPVGFLDDSAPTSSSIDGYPILGPIDSFLPLVEQHGIDDVIVALQPDDFQRFFQLIADLQQLPIQVRIVPDYVKTTLFRTMLEEYAGVPLVTLQQPRLTTFERKIKRAFDLLVGTSVLLLALPLMGIIALAIRLDSPGPALYSQHRVGENGRLFYMHKFRSMVMDADKQVDSQLHTDENGQLTFKFRNDPRITRVGHFLRRTSLDELPQILNVLKGDMSIVGPRPELPWLVETYQPWQWIRLSVPQGMTGWWQIHGRGDKPQHLHTEEDLYYIQNYSLLLDVQILWRTAGAVLKGRGAF